MRLIRFLSSVCILLLAALTFYPSASGAEDSGRISGVIKLGGTGGAMGTMGVMAKAFKKKYPKVSFVMVPHLGTRGGIMAVIEKGIDIGIGGRDISESEAGNGIVSYAYARTPFVFVTSRREMSFRLSDIASMYSGLTNTWPDGTPVRVILRPEGDIDTILLKKMPGGMDKAITKALSREGMIVALTDQESADKVEKIPGAIGTSTLAQIISEKRRLTPIAIDGASPTTKAMSEGSYPFYKEFYMVTAQRPTEAARRFVEFVYSAEGREMLVRNGQAPLSGK